MCLSVFQVEFSSYRFEFRSCLYKRAAETAAFTVTLHSVICEGWILAGR